MQTTTVVYIAIVSVIYTLIILFIIERINIAKSIIKIGTVKPRIIFDPKAVTEGIFTTENPMERIFKNVSSRKKHNEGTATPLKKIIRDLPFRFDLVSPGMKEYYENTNLKNVFNYLTEMFSKYKLNKDQHETQYKTHEQEILETSVLNIFGMCCKTINMPEEKLSEFDMTHFSAFLRSTEPPIDEDNFFKLQELKSIALIGLKLSRLPINALEYFDTTLGVETLLLVHVSTTYGLNFEFQMKNLKTLKIYDTRIKDIPCIQGLENLNTFDIRTNRIENIQLKSYDISAKDFKPNHTLKCIDLRSNGLNGGDVEKIHQVFPGLERIILDENRPELNHFKQALSCAYRGRIEFGAD